MHIPDGFLDVYTAGVTYALMALALYVALRRADLTPQNVARTSVVAAFIFLAQMYAWPIPGGTSLHLVGAALAVALLGPWRGMLAMAMVLLVQTLVFHDGGITALGANIVNMGVVGAFTAYLAYRAFKRLGVPIHAAGFAAGLLSLGVAGTVAGVEVGVAAEVLRRVGYGLAVSVPAMAVAHFLLGILEGAITGAVLAYLARRSPSWLAI